jgi:hypothetical protein
MLIDHRLNLKTATEAEFDIFGVLQNKTFVPNMLLNCIIQQAGKLVDFQFQGYETKITDIDYIFDKDFLAGLCEFDYFNQYFSNIIRYHRRQIHMYPFLLGASLFQNYPICPDFGANSKSRKRQEA